MSILRVVWLTGLLCAEATTDLVAAAVIEPSPSKAQTSTVTLKEGRLSVRVENRSLDWILEEISRQGEVAIIRDGGPARRRVSIQFQDLPLDEGLRQILKGHDAFFFYGAEGKGPASLKAVWVYPKGRGRGLQPVPPETWASTRELEGDLADPDPAVRARAVEALVERKRDGARDAALEALKDQDDQVRTRALYKATREDLELPTAALIDLALGDASPDVRFLALDALTDRPEARTVAETALNDPSPHVRQRAQEILQGPAQALSPHTDRKQSDEKRR